MKKIITSASLVVLGAASIQAAHVPAELNSMETTKPWSISVSLRGFYDDNYTTSPKNVPGGEPSSFGFELSPSASLNLPLDQTFIGLSYVYSMRYYDDRSNNRADHMHQFNAKLDHRFSEKFKVETSDSFVIAQEPTIIDSGIISTPLRTKGDVMRNTAKIDFAAQLTQLLGLELGYQNTFYDYDQEGPGSRSAVLDRMEHLFSIDLRWQVMPQTVGVLSYQYGIVNHNSDEFAIAPGFDPLGNPTPGVLSDKRDSRSHYLLVGADHTFNSQLNASVRVGGQLIDFHRLDEDEISPYADLNVTYAYAPGSYLQGGFRHQRNQTDDVGTFDNLTLDQESSNLYMSVHHKITPRLTGSILGQYQTSEFQGGLANGGTDEYFIAGANLAYRFNPHLLAEAGYNYDKLNSELSDRGFTRNRVYIGIRATY